MREGKTQSSSTAVRCVFSLLGLGACGAAFAILLSGCGSAQEIGSSAATVYGGGSSGGGGSSSPVPQPRTLNLVYNIQPRATLVTFDNRWNTAGNWPFGTTEIQFRPNLSSNAQTPAAFDLAAYPSDNFTFSKASLIVKTQRDTSDTEGIILGGYNLVPSDPNRLHGVFSGIPFDGMFTGCPGAPAGTKYLVGNSTGNTTNSSYDGGCATSPFIYKDNGSTSTGAFENLYYISHAMQNYKANEWNTFELDFAQLLSNSPFTPQQVVESKKVMVVIGDDSPIYAPTVGGTGDGRLIVNGSASSVDPLDCPTNTANFPFESFLVHKDGNSVGEAAFQGTMATPGQTAQATPVANYANYDGIQFYFSPAFPRANVDTNGLVDVNFIDLTSAIVRLKLRKTKNVPSALVVNGHGVYQSGFNTAQATVGHVDAWEADASAAQTAWDGFVTGINSGVNRTIPGIGGSAGLMTAGEAELDLNLLTIFGEDKMKELIAQGNLNVAIFGGITATFAWVVKNSPFPDPGTPTPLTSNRTYGLGVNGPNFIMAGTYYTKECVIPPTPVVSTGDGVAPTLSSITVINVTSTSVTLSWSTDENATSNILYGAGAPIIPVCPDGANSSCATASTPKSVHTITIQGLQPYKYYAFQAVSEDADANSSTSAAIAVRTLR